MLRTPDDYRAARERIAASVRVPQLVHRGRIKTPEQTLHCHATAAGVHGTVPSRDRRMRSQMRPNSGRRFASRPTSLHPLDLDTRSSQLPDCVVREPGIGDQTVNSGQWGHAGESPGGKLARIGK
jgi:hypothetical protein